MLLSLCCRAQLQRFTFSQSKMGSPFNLIFYTTDSARADQLARQCFQLVDSFNTIFSDYLPESELNRLSSTAGNGRPASVSPALLDIILRSNEAYEKSGGAFSITIGPLIKIWRTARREHTFPPDSIIRKALVLTNFKDLLVDSAANTVLLQQRGMQLDLGGIAKGYVAQQVIDFLKATNIPQALADAGGDMATGDPPPEKAGWTIGVNVPETEDDLQDKRILLHNRAVATSGDVYQYIEHNGKKYSHITDPRTGYGVTLQRNVTVIAKDGATADWLATACSILPLRKAKGVAVAMRAELMIAIQKKGKALLYFTKGFAHYFSPEKSDG